eukprot:scaffold426286_cov52-Prasinocladus_malaysianus.AAC.1
MNGFLDSILHNDWDRLTAWEGATLSMLTYLLSSVLSMMLWLHIRVSAETSIVQVALDDCRSVPEP